MSNYFSQFPKIKYGDHVVRNITLRVKILDSVKHDPFAFLPYTLKEGEKAEDIAYHYYGSTEYVWLVWLSNQIVDPYFQWPLDENEFFKYIVKKYKEMALESTGSSYMNDYEIYAWTMNDTITDNIVHYKNGEILMAPDTYRLSNIALEGWIPVRIFDYEFDLNENMRNIQLLNRSFKTIADENLKRLLNG